MCALDFPAPSFTAVLGLGRLIGFARHVWRVTALANFTIDRLAHVALIETEMLRLGGSRLGSFDRDGVQRRGD